MKQRNSLLLIDAVLVGRVAALSMVYGLIALMDTGAIATPGTAIWLTAILCCSVMLRLFLRKERRVVGAVWICAACFGAQVILSMRFSDPFFNGVGVLCSLYLWVYSYVLCCRYVIYGVKMESILTTFDMDAVLLAVALLFQGQGGQDDGNAGLLGCAMVLVLLALVSKRTMGGQRGLRCVRGGGTVAGLAAVLCGSAVLLVLAISGGLRNGVLTLWQGVCDGANFLWQKINESMFYLVSLFPEDCFETVVPEEGDTILSWGGGAQGGAASNSRVGFYIFASAGLLLAIAVGISILRGMKRSTVGGGTGVGAVSRKKPGVSDQLKELWHALCLWLYYVMHCVTGANSAPGLFAKVERRAFPRYGKRREGETYRAYLKRVEPGYPGKEASLCSLADALDAAFYGGEEPTTDLRALRRSLFGKK